MPVLRLSSLAAALNLPAGRLAWGLQLSLLALAYCLSGRVGAALPSLDSYSVLMWAPAGIALAAFFRLGRGCWPAVWIAGFLLEIGGEHGILLAALRATAATVAPLVAGLWLRRSQISRSLDCSQGLDDSSGQSINVLIAAVMITATLKASFDISIELALAAIPLGQIAAAAWMNSWLSTVLGTAALALPCLAVSRTSLTQALGPSPSASSLALWPGVLIAGFLAFSAVGRASAMLLPLILAPHALVAWLAASRGGFAGSVAVVIAGTGAGCAAVAGLAASPWDGTPSMVSWLWGYGMTLVMVPMLVTIAKVRSLAEIAHRESKGADKPAASLAATAELDVRTGRVALSPRWLEMLGLAPQELDIPASAFWDRIHPDDVALVRRCIEPLRLASQEPVAAECRMLCRDGDWKWFELRTEVTARSSAGAPRLIAFVGRSEDRLHSPRNQLLLLESLFQTLNEGLLITDAQSRIVKVNPVYCRITGSAEAELLGTVPEILRNSAPGTVQADQADQAARIFAGMQSGGAWRGEVTTQHKNGEPCTLHVTVSVVKGTDGLVQNHVLAFSDVTQSRRQIVQLQRQAHFDELTGLPNRARLSQLLLDALASSQRDGSLLTVCCLDLDHFKAVNEEFGHFGGDQLLQQLAERMRRSLRTSAHGDDIVARIGGDEFVFLLRVTTVEESRLAVERLLRIIGLPFGLSSGEAPVVVTASIGATVFPLDNADADTLLRHAGHAMYGAKQSGRSGYHFFDAEHNRLAEARVVELGRVQDALNSQELCLHFQPKVDMRNGRVLGVEALLRWNHPEQGLLPPAHFLPLIEQTGLSTSVGEWVLKKGIEQLTQWQSMGMDLTVSINVSARHLQEPTFASRLADILAQQPLPVADRLILEVLETTALADIDFTCSLMEACRALGVRFALDDFGTGYSTLTYLKRLPVDMLKIDRSFVINMLDDRQDLAIVEGVISLSKTFGCSVVAEGVETLEQAQALIELGCDIGQGNGIAPAMPAEDVIAWIHEFGGMTTLAAPLTP